MRRRMLLVSLLTSLLWLTSMGILFIDDITGDSALVVTLLVAIFGYLFYLGQRITHVEDKLDMHIHETRRRRVG